MRFIIAATILYVLVSICFFILNAIYVTSPALLWILAVASMLAIITNVDSKV
jgi:hypothetical protein